MQPEKQPTQQEQQTIEKSNQHINLTRFGNVPTSSRQGREDFIDSTINTTNTRGKLEGILGNSFGIQYMRALASIYSHRVPEFMKTQVGFNPIQKRNSNPKRKVQTRLSVDRLVDRPCHGRPAAPTGSEATSVGRPGPVDRSFLCTPVHAGRPGGRPASSTGRPGGRPGAPLAYSMRRFSLLCRLISVLTPSIFSISSLPQ